MALTNMAYHRSYRSCLSQTSTVELVILLTRLHASCSVHVLGYGISALANLAHRNKAIVRSITAMGGRILLRDGLVLQAAASMQVAVHVMHALATFLTVDPEQNCEFFWTEVVCFSVLKVLMRYGKSSISLTKHGLLVLTLLCNYESNRNLSVPSMGASIGSSRNIGGSSSNNDSNSNSSKSKRVMPTAAATGAGARGVFCSVSVSVTALDLLTVYVSSLHCHHAVVARAVSLLLAITQDQLDAPGHMRSHRRGRGCGSFPAGYLSGCGRCNQQSSPQVLRVVQYLRDRRAAQTLQILVVSNIACGDAHVKEQAREVIRRIQPRRRMRRKVVCCRRKAVCCHCASLHWWWCWC